MSAIPPSRIALGNGQIPRVLLIDRPPRGTKTSHFGPKTHGTALVAWSVRLRRSTEGRTIRQALASPLFGRTFTGRPQPLKVQGETLMGLTRNFVLGLMIAAAALSGA